MRQWAIVTCLIFITIQIVYAQSAQTSLRDQSANDQNDHLAVNASFSITDALGNPIENFDPGIMELVVDGQSYFAEPFQPEIPFYVVLSVDTSGSMTQAYRQMVSMASNIAQSAPEQGMFALQSFHKTSLFNVSFTGSMDALLQQMTSLRPVQNSGTCVFDALMSALDVVNAQGMEGRRAVILMTDGVDRLPSGAGCSQSTVDDVILKARTIAPLYIIAVDGNDGLNTLDLTRLARDTKGAYFDNTALDVSGRLQTVMNILRLQWYVNFSAYPREGNHDATLRFSNNQSTPITFTVTAPRTYEQLFALCSLEQKFTFDPARKVMSYPLCIQGAGRIGTLKASLIDTQTDNAVLNSEQIITNYQGPIEFDGLGLKLEPGQRYAMSLTGTNTTGQPLFVEPISIEFTYDAPTVEAAEPKLEVSSFTRAENAAVLTLNISNSIDSIRKIEVLRNDQSGDLTPLTTITQINSPLPIPIDLTGLKSNSAYTFIVRAKDEQGNTIGETEHTFDMPDIALPAIEIMGAVQEGQDTNQKLLVTIASQNIPVDATTSIQLMQQESSKPLISDTPVGGPPQITLPISSLSSGEYVLIVQVKDKNGNLLAAAPAFAVPLTITFSFGHQIRQMLLWPPFVAVLLLLLAASVYTYVRLSRGHSLFPKHETAVAPAIRNPTDQVRSDDSINSISRANRIGFQEMLAAQSVTVGEIEIVHSQARQGEKHPINKNPYVIGRIHGHLTINDRSISSKHLEISFDASQITIYNHSRYGTQVASTVLKTPQAHTTIPRTHNHVVELYLPNAGGVNLRITIL